MPRRLTLSDRILPVLRPWHMMPGLHVFRGMRDAAGHWTWQDFNNGMPDGAIVTKLRVNSAFGTIHAATYGRGAFALDTISFF